MKALQRTTVAFQRMIGNIPPEARSDPSTRPGIRVTPLFVVMVGAALILALVQVPSWLNVPAWFTTWLHLLLPILLILATGLYAVHYFQSRLWQAADENQVLREKAHFQGLLVDSLRESLVATDLQGRVTCWNKSAERRYGRAAGEMLGQPVAQLLNLPISVEEAERLTESGLDGWSGEHQVLGRDGILSWVETRTSALRSAQGQLAGFAWVQQDITKRKQAELDLQESESRFNTLFNNSQVAMLLVEPETGRIVNANQAACRFYGYDLETLHAKKLLDLSQPPQEDLLAHLADGVERGWSHFYFTLRRSDGQQRQVEAYINTVIYGGRNLIMPVLYDVTEPRQTEAALAESERRLRAVMEHVHLAAVMVDMEDRITFCNNFTAQVSGWRKEELIGQLWYERFLLAEDQSTIVEKYKRLLDADQVAAYVEQNFQNRSGKQVTMAWNIILLRDPQGRPSGLAALGQDITGMHQIKQDEARRMAEMESLRQAGRFLTASSDLSKTLSAIVAAARLLLGSQAAGVLLHDPRCGDLELAAVDGDATLFRNLLGSAEGVSIGSRTSDRSGVAGWVLHQRQPVLAPNLPHSTSVPAKTSQHSLISVPMIFQGRSIGVMEVENATAAQFNESHLTILSVLADFATMAVINARLLAAEREQRHLLELSQAQLIRSEKMNAMGRLVAVLAHEINNPLQSLRSGFSLLNETQLDETKQRAYLQIAHQEVERLSGIVERVLTFYRSSETQSPVDLHLLLEETLALMEKRLEQTGIRTECQYSADLPRVDGFSDQLHQVFLNLILNALAAMPNGGCLTLTTRVDEASDRVQIAIHDTGTGIPAEVLPHIFEPFFTTNSDGSGLGLSISYSIIEKHQGWIEVESTPSGSCFTVVLPIHAQTTAPDGEAR